MSITTEYFEDQGLVITTFTGTITSEEFLKNNQKLTASLSENEHYRFILADWSEAE